MNSDSYDVSICDTCGTSVDQLSTNDTMSDNSNSEQTVQSKLSWTIKIFFAFGHIYNDLCASVWFSYTLIFFQNQFNGSVASILILLGQVADALATPFVGFFSDRNNTNQLLCRYGKRKTWHLLGTVLVSASFPFIFNKCINCESASEMSQIIYYGFFIVIFQFGWAAVQVGHVSLITDLTQNTKERVELNAYRQAATVASSICVYTIAWFIFSRKGDSIITKEDSDSFTLIVYIVCAIGVVFSILFNVFVKEVKASTPNTNTSNQSLYNSSDDLVNNNQYRKRVCSVSSVYECNGKDECLKDYTTSKTSFSSGNPENGNKKSSNAYKWSDWLKNLNFYKIAFIYMVARLFVNLTQVYTSLFLQNTLHLPKASIAIIPFVTYISGFVWSLLSRLISSKTGPKILLVIGCVFGLGSCFWNSFGSVDNESFKHWQVYGSALLFGIGGTTMLIASLALTSDLIGINTTSSAFVFGTMSFFDKVLNGSVVVILEQINPYKSKTGDDKFSNTYYKQVVVYVSGAAAILTLLAVIPIIKTKFVDNSQQTCDEKNNKPKAEEMKY